LEAVVQTDPYFYFYLIPSKAGRISRARADSDKLLAFPKMTPNTLCHALVYLKDFDAMTICYDKNNKNIDAMSQCL
jgi:hypothetical protein